MQCIIVLIHKFLAIVKSIMKSNLNYWDEVIIINKLVSHVIQLYPLNQDLIWFFVNVIHVTGIYMRRKIIILIMGNMLRYWIFHWN